MDDETTLSSSESTESEETTEEKPETQAADGAESDNSETGEESREAAMVPSHRLREETAKRKEMERIAKWYQENVGDPDTVLKFRKWQEEQKAAAEKTGGTADKELTPEQIKAVERLVLKSMPWLQEVSERYTTSQEVMVEMAEDQTHKLAKAAGLPTDKDSLGRIDYLVGAEMMRDPKLARMWKAGNVSAVEQAFERVKDFLGKTGRPSTATTKRAVTKLAPVAGGAAAVSAASPGKHIKGLAGDAGKQAADQAWALINQET